MDGTSVYYTTLGNPYDGYVKRTGPPTGGFSGQSTVASMQHLTYAVAVDPSGVYFADNAYATVTVRPSDGGTAKVLTTAGGGYTLLVDETSVYFATGALNRLPKNGGTPVVLAPMVGQSGDGIAMDDKNIYWTVSDPTANGLVMSVPKQGGPPKTIAAGESAPGPIAADGKHVYWATVAGTGSIRRAPLDGGAVVTLATSYLPTCLALDSTHVFWVSAKTGANEIWRVPVGGGPSQLIAKPSSASYTTKVNAIAVDSTWLYWTRQGSLAPSVGMVGAVAK